MQGVDRHRICFFVFAGSKKCTRDGFECCHPERSEGSPPSQPQKQCHQPRRCEEGFARCGNLFRTVCHAEQREASPRWSASRRFFVTLRMTAQGTIANC